MNAAVDGAVRARSKAACIAVAGLFLVVQVLLWFAYYGNGAKSLIGDEQSYQEFALAILGGGPWMPSTIWPPLQGLFLASIYAIFGVHIVVVQLVQTLLFIGCAMLLRGIWRKIGGSVRGANLAAALFLLNPANAAYAHWLWPEVLHLFLVLCVFRLLMEAVSSRLASAAAGVCTGLALLAKSLLAGFWPVFLIAFLRNDRPRFRIVPALFFVFGIAVATAPALWHGWRTFGRPMIADSSIYNLWVGLTDHSRVDYVDDMGGVTLPEFLASGTTPQERNAVYLRKIEDIVAERGVARIGADQISRQYFRLFSVKTPLLSQLPGAACAGYLSVYHTSPSLTRTLTLGNDAFHVLMLAGFAFGAACWRRRPGLALALVGGYLIYQLALMSVVHVKARFLFPMIPFLCAFAGTFYADLRAHIAGVASERLAFTAPRLIVGAVLAALLLVLAFAGPALDGICAG